MRDIPGHEGRYAITEDGRVWAHPKQFGRNGSRSHDGMWLIARPHVKGYLVVQLCNADGNHVTRLVHRLVAETYIPNPSGLPQVNHRDGNKKANAVTNLEWCSASHNIRHAVATGLTKSRKGIPYKRIQQGTTP